MDGVFPAGFNNNNNNANAWNVNNNGNVNNNNVNNNNGVRLAISLIAHVIIFSSNGNGIHGSSTNPYVVKTN